MTLAPLCVLAATAGEADGAKSAGLPQFDVTTFPSQLFWMALVFIVTYVVFSKKILPELSGIIQDRKNRIEGDLRTAQDLREEIELVRTEYEKAISDARDNASGHIQAVQAEARTKAEHAAKEFGDKVVQEIADYEVKIEGMKDQALSNIRDSIAGASCDIVEKTSGMVISEDDALARLDEKLGLAKAA